MGCALLLTSCIKVGDFGKFWDKGVVDPDLQGKWQTVSMLGKEKGEPMRAVTFKKSGDHYEIFSMSEEPVKVKTLKITDGKFFLWAKKYKLMMISDKERFGVPRSGEIYPYEIKNGTLKVYSIETLSHYSSEQFNHDQLYNHLSQEELFEKYKPEIEKISNGRVNQEGTDDLYSIGKLDEAMDEFKNIVVNPEFWSPDSKTIRWQAIFEASRTN